MDIAHQEYVEHLEEEMDEYIRDSKHNTQILQIFRMKAAWPEKYREDVKIQGLEPLTQLLEEARKLAARDIERRRRLEQGATEGDFREMGKKGNSKQREVGDEGIAGGGDCLAGVCDPGAWYICLHSTS
jgi:hypothetical protein